MDLSEVLLEVAAWHPRFIEAFTAVSGGGTRLADLHVTIAAVLTAHALNIGYPPVMSSGIAALTRDRLSHVDQNYLRAETYAAANAPLIEAQTQIELAQAWGGGLVAAIDGMRFVVPIPTIHARPNPKYFGRRRGAQWLNMVNDQALGLGGKVVAGTPRDSLHTIDVIYSQDGGPRPEVIVTDTASYTDVGFGMLHLLGFSYRPQLADLPDQKLWRIDPAASIHTGTVTAHDALRVLSRDGHPTPLGSAVAAYARIFKPSARSGAWFWWTRTRAGDRIEVLRRLTPNGWYGLVLPAVGYLAHLVCLPGLFAGLAAGAAVGATAVYGVSAGLAVAAIALVLVHVRGGRSGLARSR